MVIMTSNFIAMLSFFFLVCAYASWIPTDWRAELPVPILPSQPGWVEFYYDAWRIADMRKQHVPLGWHFSNAFSPVDIYQWDEVWISTFAKYVQLAHPKVTNPMTGIDQLYSAQKDSGYITYKWHGYNDTGRVQSPIFSYGELSYLRHIGDVERAKRILPILDRYFFWVKQNLSTTDGPYRMSHMGNGMDNRPHGDLIIDLTAQQAMNAFLLSEIAHIVGDNERKTKFEGEFVMLKDVINEKMWIKEDKFYGDLNTMTDGSLNQTNTWTAASFWPLMSEIPSNDQVNGLIKALYDTENFKTAHMVPSVGKKSMGYDPRGNYWRGSTWIPTTTICVKGLGLHGYPSLAAEIATNDMDAMYKVWLNNGTIFENYWQEDNTGKAPITRAEKNFVGWSGVTPIATLIENILGVQTNALTKQITWVVTLKVEHGIRNLRWGDSWKNSVDLLISGENTKQGTRTISVNSTSNFELEVIFPQSSVSQKFFLTATQAQRFVVNNTKE